MDGNFVSTADDGTVRWIWLERDERLNAMTVDLCKDLYDVLFEAGRDPNVRAVVISGRGRSFCSGGDLKAMIGAEDPEAYLHQLAKSIHSVVTEIRRVPKPVIAAVNGHAAGAGCSLALSCDMKVAARGARFNMGFLNVGLAPGCGTWFLAHHVGIGIATDLVFTGRTFTADEALDLGIVNLVTENNDLEGAVMDMSQTLVKRPAKAMARAKDLLNRVYESSLQAQLDQESRYLSVSARSEEFREGISAFVEKRKPDFASK